MLPDPVSNPGPLIYESGALPIALRGPAYNHTCISNTQTVSLVLTSNTQPISVSGDGANAWLTYKNCKEENRVMRFKLL